MYKRYYGHQEIYVSLTSVRCVTLQASLASSRVKQVWQVELLRERSYVDILREHAQLHMNVTPEYNVEIVGTPTAPSSVTNHARSLLSSRYICSIGSFSLIFACQRKQLVVLCMNCIYTQ